MTTDTARNVTTTEVYEDALLTLHSPLSPSPGLSLGLDVAVEDDGTTVVLSRGAVVWQPVPGDMVLGKPVVSLIRHLAGLPRGTRLSVADFDAVVESDGRNATEVTA